MAKSTRIIRILKMPSCDLVQLPVEKPGRLRDSEPLSSEQIQNIRPTGSLTTSCCELIFESSLSENIENIGHCQAGRLPETSVAEG